MDDQEFDRWKKSLEENVNEYCRKYKEIKEKYRNEHLIDTQFDEERSRFSKEVGEIVNKINIFSMDQIDILIKIISSKEMIPPSSMDAPDGMAQLKIKLLLKKINLIVTDWSQLIYRDPSDKNFVELQEINKVDDDNDIKCLDSLIDQLMHVTGNLKNSELLKDLQNTKLRHAVTERIVQRSRFMLDDQKHIELSQLLTSDKNMLVQWLKTPTSHGITRGLSRLWGGSTSSLKKLTKEMSKQKKVQTGSAVHTNKK